MRPDLRRAADRPIHLPYHLAKRADPARLSDRARLDKSLRPEIRRVFEKNRRASSSAHAGFVLDTLEQAVHDRRPAKDMGLVHHSDRGSQSLSLRDTERLAEAGLEPSVGSVGDSCNTASSMGRLTLNMLLSFAQFEREGTAERIRDKISASKKKGLWMGGTVPLASAPNGRTRLIDETLAPTVRTLFDLSLKHQSLRQVQIEAVAIGLRTRLQFTVRGPGNVPFAKGHIHAIPSNPVYAGRIRRH